ncbi:MAG: hypothetical protein F4Z53_13850 [Acidimicrobiales bacterium]|nr:hypothetical protein [Acidimicrobiales bacterium]MYD33936.1 hypothetical protein [Acidimicrobiales bacterium]MYI09902.1 hypothetical protein [Acidimicrobiales bacterium]
MSNPAQFRCKTRGCDNVAGIDYHGHQHDYCGVCSRLYWMEQKLNDILGILVNNVNGGPRNLDTVDAELNEAQRAALDQLDARRESANA